MSSLQSSKAAAAAAAAAGFRTWSWWQLQQRSPEAL
jgi:hypothetical protein